MRPFWNNFHCFMNMYMYCIMNRCIPVEIACAWPVGAATCFTWPLCRSCEMTFRGSVAGLAVVWELTTVRTSWPPLWTSTLFCNSSGMLRHEKLHYTVWFHTCKLGLDATGVVCRIMLLLPAASTLTSRCSGRTTCIWFPICSTCGCAPASTTCSWPWRWPSMRTVFAGGDATTVLPENWMTLAVVPLSDTGLPPTTICLLDDPRTAKQNTLMQHLRWEGRNDERRPTLWGFDDTWRDCCRVTKLSCRCWTLHCYLFKETRT